MPDDSWWSKGWALWGERSELEQARQEFAPLVRKYKPLANRIIDIIFGTDDAQLPPHAEAKAKVIEAFREQVTDAERLDQQREERGG